METVRLKKRFQGFRDQSGYGASFQNRCGGATKKQFFAIVVEAARILRSEWRRREFPYQGGDGAIFQTKAETARLRNNF